MRYRFYTADVFTDRLFGGNPLAVFPEGRGLDAEQMRQVAREFNVSETVFVFPADAAGHAFRLRIFTPGVELPLPGIRPSGPLTCWRRSGPFLSRDA